jgi:alanine racemase
LTMDPVKQKGIPLRPSLIEVDLDALCFNVKSIKERLGEGVKLLAVVKANAYGLGALEISRAASEAGADYLGVAIVEEGIQLREAGITTPILMLYPEPPERAPSFLEYDLNPTVSNQAFLREFNELCCRARKIGGVFLKLDSGMGRYGLPPRDLLSLAGELKRMESVRLEGLSTNLSDPEENNRAYSRKQVEVFREVDQELQRLGFGNYLRSVANSTAFLDLPESYFDLVRIGHLLYGSYPSENRVSDVPLKPVLVLKSRVLWQREVAFGQPIGYGLSYITKRLTKVATIPIGYADGVPRGLSNRGQVLIRGRRADIIGRVCMDALMVDVTDIPGVGVGDEVVLVGRQGEEKITLHEIAKAAGSISYEIMSRLSPRLPRVFKYTRKQAQERQREEELVGPTLTEKAD